MYMYMYLFLFQIELDRKNLLFKENDIPLTCVDTIHQGKCF